MRTATTRPYAGCLLAAVLLLPTAAGAAADPVGTWPMRPVPEVVERFDPPSSTWGAGHRGVDLAGSSGQPVRSALAGSVAFVGSVAGRPVVVVEHGGTRTTYEPVIGLLARGDPVAAGEVIGRLGLVGSHCFPRACLHWGWLRGETYLDPLRLVGGGPVRLLPLDGLTPALPEAGAREPLSSLSPRSSLPTATGTWAPLLELVEDWW